MVCAIFLLCGCESKQEIKKRERQDAMIYELYDALHKARNEFEHIGKECEDTLDFGEPSYTEETVGIIEVRCEDMVFTLDKIIDKYALDINY